MGSTARHRGGDRDEHPRGRAAAARPPSRGSPTGRSSRSRTASTAEDFAGPSPHARRTTPSGSCTPATSTPSSAASTAVARRCGACSAAASPASTSSRARTSTSSRRSTRCSPRSRAAPTRVELHLAGRSHRADREVAARCPVVQAARLRHACRVDRADARRRTSSSCRCRTCPPGVRATIVPGQDLRVPRVGHARSSARCPRRRARHPHRGRERGARAAGRRRRRWPRRCGADQAFRDGAEPLTTPDVVARFEYRQLAEQLADGLRARCSRRVSRRRAGRARPGSSGRGSSGPTRATSWSRTGSRASSSPRRGCRFARAPARGR